MSSPLPAPNRHITTLLPSGKSAFVEVSPHPRTDSVSNGASVFHLAYAADTSPSGRPDLASDLAQYEEYSAAPPPVVNPKGSTFRVIDMAPGSSSPMHRTVSLDYGCVVAGSVKLTLDGGESRTLNPGDVVVQRGTGHAWHNASSTEWARMVFVVMASEPLVVAGNEFKDYMGAENGP